MRKLLVVYNQCGISGRENVPYYRDAIYGLYHQKFDDFRVVVSGCCTGNVTRGQLYGEFRNHISYCYVDDKLPLYVTFNFAVQKAFEYLGEFEAVLYVDSGVCVYERPDIFSRMWDAFKSGPYAMVSAMTSNDTGLSWWFKDPNHPIYDAIQNDKNYEIPLGSALNLHFQIFSKELIDAYGRPSPCRFASDTGESVSTFLCAGINRKLLFVPSVKVLHAHSMDGASSGFRGQILYPPDTTLTMEEIYQNGYELGFGYEECGPGFKHDPACYDENEYPKNPKLREFLKDSLFLKPAEFDYNSIKHSFI